MASLKGMPTNRTLRLVLILFCGITAVTLFFQRKLINHFGDSDKDASSHLFYKGIKVNFNTSRKDAVGNLQSAGRKIFIAFSYWEQLTAATNNFLDLTAVAAYSGRQVVVPFVKNSRLLGFAKNKPLETLELYYNVSALNRTLLSRGHGTLISWKEFQDVCRGKLDVVVRFDYTKLTKTSKYYQAARPFIPCKASHTETIQSAGVTVGKTICMNVFAVKSDKKFENEVIERLPCVGLDQWRGSNTKKSYRAQFQISPNVTQRLHSDEAAIFFNSKLFHIALEFITTNLDPLFISAHIRTEKILTHGRHIKNMATVKKCISSLTARVQSYNNASTVSVPIFLASDFADFGSSSIDANTPREKSASLMNILAPLKPIVFEPSTYNLTDRGTVAIVEMNILVSGKHLFVVGGGTFQWWIIKEFLRKNNIHRRDDVKCRSALCNTLCDF